MKLKLKENDKELILNFTSGSRDKTHFWVQLSPTYLYTDSTLIVPTITHEMNTIVFSLTDLSI
jgi:hypothetical protein